MSLLHARVLEQNIFHNQTTQTKIIFNVLSKACFIEIKAFHFLRSAIYSNMFRSLMLHAMASSDLINQR